MQITFYLPLTVFHVYGLMLAWVLSFLSYTLATLAVWSFTERDRRRDRIAKLVRATTASIIVAVPAYVVFLIMKAN